MKILENPRSCLPSTFSTGAHNIRDLSTLQFDAVITHASRGELAKESQEQCSRSWRTKNSKAVRRTDASF